MGTIADKLNYLNKTKGLIKQAIIEKGVEVKETDTFRSYANKISTIQGGTGTEDLSIELTEQDTLLTAQKITIEDIINTLENKSAGSGTDTSDATATSFDIAKGKTAYVKGEKIEGLIPTVEVGEKIEYTQSTDAKKVYPILNQVGENWETFNGLAVECPVSGYHFIKSGAFVKAMVADNLVAEAIDLTSDKIAEGIELLGIKGTFQGGIDTSDATATSGDLLLGKTAYANEEKIEGTIETWDGTINGEYKLYNPLNDYILGTKKNITADDLKDVTKIRNYLFYYSDITSIDFPNNVTSLGNHVFQGCNGLKSITLGKGITNIGTECFKECAFVEITIPSNVMRLDSYTFRNCEKLENVIIEEGIQTMGNGIFEGCDSLTKVVLPNSLLSLENYVFQYCSSLASITLGTGISSIKGAFNRCTNLKELIVLRETPPTLNSQVLTQLPEDCVIKVPTNSVEAYKTATNWSARADYIVAYEEE